MSRTSRIAGAIGLAVLLGACSTQQPATSIAMRSMQPETPLPSATLPTSAASPTQSGEAALEFTWAEHPLDAAVLGVGGVAVDGDRIVVVGGTDAGPAAWTSGDGISWETHAVPPGQNLIDADSPLPNATGAMGTLVRLDETIYSLGQFAFMDFVRPVGWRWTDGEPWQFIESSSEFYASGAVADVVAANGHLVAVRREVALSWEGADSTVWRWTADTSWVQADLSVGDPQRVYVTDIAWDGQRFVATGLVPSTDDDMAAVAAWESPDGMSWSSLEPPAADQVCGLEAGANGGFVALGVGLNGISAWQSTDAGWTETVLSDSAPQRPDVGGPYLEQCDVVALDRATVATFVDDDGAHVWTSPDGSSWTSQGTLPSGGLVSGAGDLVVMVTGGDPAAGAPPTIRIGRLR